MAPWMYRQAPWNDLQSHVNEAASKNNQLSMPTKRQTRTRQINRPFYRYGGHIELIRLKEYYRMPRGHEHISFLFSGAFRDIFS